MSLLSPIGELRQLLHVSTSGERSEGTPGVRIGTSWTSRDIYLRRNFELITVPSELRLYHDEAVQVYLNGQLVKPLEGYTTGFIDVEMDNAEGLLNAGENTVAVHCHQSTGGQGVDVGLIKKKLPYVER